MLLALRIIITHYLQTVLYRPYTPLTGMFKLKYVEFIRVIALLCENSILLSTVYKQGKEAKA